MAKVKTTWKKTTPFGDYSKTSDRVNAKKNNQTMIIREAKSLFVAGKHAGSKTTKRLLQGIAKAHEAQAASKKKDKD